jgi:hypothetical protein
VIGDILCEGILGSEIVDLAKSDKPIFPPRLKLQPGDPVAVMVNNFLDIYIYLYIYVYIYIYIFMYKHIHI